MAFGGAGPLHGCALADMLGITTVLVPPAPGVLCAEGLLTAQLRSEFSRSVIQVTEREVADVFQALQAEAEAWFEEEEVPLADWRTTRMMLMCYEGQGSELPVAWAGDLAATKAAFAAAHQGLYGFTLELPVRLITIRLDAAGGLMPPVHAPLPRGENAEPDGTTPVHFASGTQEATLYERGRMGAGDRCNGPAIITQLDATTLVPPGWSGVMHESGVLVLQLE